jgi:hypothetical protein
MASAYAGASIMPLVSRWQPVRLLLRSWPGPRKKPRESLPPEATLRQKLQ